MKLTKEQTKIISHAYGPAFVDAGAGAGKTETVCLTIKKLIDRGSCPENIQVLTFTKVANKNIEDRLHKADDKYHQVRTSTFHSFGFGIIKENWSEFGFSKEPKLISNKSWGKVVDHRVGKVAAEHGIRKVKLSKAVSKALLQRNNGKIKPKSKLSKATAEAVKGLQNYKLQKNWVDYNDMLNLVAEVILT